MTDVFGDDWNGGNIVFSIDGNKTEYTRTGLQLSKPLPSLRRHLGYYLHTMQGLGRRKSLHLDRSQ